MRVDRITYNDAVDAVRDYTTAFTHNVSAATKERWVELLMELRPAHGILSAAIKRCAENDLGAAWSRLRGAINTETTLARQKGDGGLGASSAAFDDWVREYRNEGLSGGFPPPPLDNSREQPTDAETAAACWRVVHQIVSGRLRCPEPWDKHDIYADGDEEERWFWMRVEAQRDSVGH